MKQQQPINLALRLAAAAGRSSARPRIPASVVAARRQQTIHTTPAPPATVSPSIHGSGPPPDPPQPTADSPNARLERRRKQADLLKQARDIRQSQKQGSGSGSGSGIPLARKRFWKDVKVVEVDGMLEVHLDARPLRHPHTKDIVRLPTSKPLLAGALAIEWDMLVSVQQATKQHLIPLTSTVCRALDIADDDAVWGFVSGGLDGEGRGAAMVLGQGKRETKEGDVSESIRTGIARTVLRYLDTDSLLCWAPAPKSDDTPGPDGLTLRETQQRAAEEVVGFLGARVWPGVEIEPVLDEHSIMPRRQKEETRKIIEGWIMGLNAWELAGLERGVLAAKSLLGAARLVVEWSSDQARPGGLASSSSSSASASAPGGKGKGKFWGVEEAAQIASIEVDWQTGRWGEVEDTHDVEKEDLRRQLGSVVLLVGGVKA